MIKKLNFIISMKSYEFTNAGVMTIKLIEETAYMLTFSILQ